MGISTIWKSSKAGKKKTRPAYKPKIRWELLGLSDPEATESTPSIESIRKEVSSLASRGFGQGTRSRSTVQETSGRKGTRQTGGRSVGRRGATE